MTAPLPEKMRPQTLEEIVGQEHLTHGKGFLKTSIASGKPQSIILWGPPGCGKTSIAKIYAKAFNLPFESLNAIFSGIADLKRIIKETESSPLFGGRILLFVDEIHRFNKSQQDAFLPYIENGTLILVGATAENPTYYLNSALLSRVRILELKALNSSDLTKILERFESKFSPLKIDDAGRQLLLDWSHGDGRYLLNMIESVTSAGAPMSADELKDYLQRRAPLFDKGGDQHYNLISALHKAVRGSDPQAAIYWFLRMIHAGEDPLFIARRVIRMATEDIGLADPNGLLQAHAAWDAYERLGSPEGELAIAQAIVYLALAPKSNALYAAFGEARSSAEQTAHLPPPMHIQNPANRTMAKMGRGKGYVYDPDTPESFSGQNYFPEGMQREDYYRPFERGFEREMKKRIDYFNTLRNKNSD